MRPAFLVVCSLIVSTSALRIGSTSKQDSEVDSEASPQPKKTVTSSTIKHARAEGDDKHVAIAPHGMLLVVGSLNVDRIVEIERLPAKDETITAHKPAEELALGGKGANQAIAAARLVQENGPKCEFSCQFGNDAHAKQMENVLVANGVGLKFSGRSTSPSGQGIAMLQADGSVSAVVLGGSNAAWTDELARELATHVKDASILLLQREIPESVNEVLVAAADRANVPIIFDVGGEDRQ